MIIDYTIEQSGDFIIATDFTHKPKIKKLNIQIISPSNKIINTTYYFRKINTFGKGILGVLENGIYIFNIGGVIKVINFKFEVELTEVEKAYFRIAMKKEAFSIVRLKHSTFVGFLPKYVKNEI